MKLDNSSNSIVSMPDSVPDSVPESMFIPSRYVPAHACERCRNFGGVLCGSTYTCNMCKHVSDLTPKPGRLPKFGEQLPGRSGLQMNYCGKKCGKCNSFGGNLHHYTNDEWVYTCATCYTCQSRSCK